MEPQKWISLTKRLLKEISTDKNNIREYYLTRVKHRKIKTQINYLVCLKNLFTITGKNNEKLLEKADILNLLESEWFNSLKPFLKNGNNLNNFIFWKCKFFFSNHLRYYFYNISIIFY